MGGGQLSKNTSQLLFIAISSSKGLFFKSFGLNEGMCYMLCHLDGIVLSLVASVAAFEGLVHVITTASLGHSTDHCQLCCLKSCWLLDGHLFVVVIHRGCAILTLIKNDLVAREVGESWSFPGQRMSWMFDVSM